MDESWKAVLLGIVEGLTEFVPVSSTGHLLIGAALLRFQQSVGGTFEVFIQLGAVLAVLGYYAADLWSQARTLPHSAAVRRFWIDIVVAFLPVALVGLFLRDWIKEVLFASPSVIAWALIVGGGVLIAVERLPRRPAAVRSVTGISLRQAVVVGIVQVCALVPGVSRSAASIVGGMLAGMDRETATRFSFYLAIPTLGAATVFELARSFDRLTPDDLRGLLLGLLAALAVAWASIGWLLRYVARHSFVAFGVYRIAAGVVILLLVQLRVL